MGPVQHAEYFPDHRPERTLIEPDRDGLPLDRMKNAQAAVCHGRRLGRIGREFPLKAAVRLAAALDMLAQIGT